jgi:CheY-like chemotaxis protein
VNLKLFNVLLADDDTDDCIFFKKALEELQLDTHLTTVNDGEELMKYLDKNSANLPDVLFLDLNMPRKTGFECLTEIKENETLKNLPVIVFTISFGKGISLEQGLANTLTWIGAEEYIRKPSDFEQFKQIIYKVIIRLQKKDLLTDKGEILD